MSAVWSLVFETGVNAGPRLCVAPMRRCDVHLSHALPFFLRPPAPRPPSPSARSFLVCTSAVGVTVPSGDGNCPFATVLIAIWFGVYGCGLLIDSLSPPLSLSFCLCLHKMLPEMLPVVPAVQAENLIA